MVASTIVPVVIRPLGLQVQVHRPQDLFPQLVFFQRVPELAHRDLVRPIGAHSYKV
jgi:hypothetical protein